MSCLLSVDLSLDCRSSKGGIKRVLIANTSSFTYSVSSGVATITKVSGRRFFEYHLTLGSSSASSPFAGDRAVGGRFYTPTVTIQIPKQDVTKRNEIKVLAAANVGIIVEDENGNYFLYGASRGLEVSEGDAPTGTAGADLNGYTLTFTGEELDLPYSVSSAAISGLLTA